MKPTASFNSLDFASSVPGLIVIGTTPYRYPDLEITTDGISSNDKSVTSSSYVKSKKLNVTVEIGQNTRALLDASVDILYRILNGLEKPLILGNGTSTRQWIATLSNVMVSDVQGGHGTYDIEFIAADPFGYETSSTSLFSTALTGGSSNTAFTGIVGGSAEWQVPIITITFASTTIGTGTYFSIGNPATSQVLTITDYPTTADVYVIDCSIRKVTKNGVEITSLSGAFPEWTTAAAGSMDYVDNFSARSRTMSGLYYKRYK